AEALKVLIGNNQAVAVETAKAAKAAMEQGLGYADLAGKTGTTSEIQKGLTEEVKRFLEKAEAEHISLEQLAKSLEQTAQKTGEMTEAQKKSNEEFAAANTAATTLYETLQKIKPGDILKAIPAEQLQGYVDRVLESLQKIEQSGKFTSQQVEKAWTD